MRVIYDLNPTANIVYMYIHVERTAYSVSPDGHSDSEGEKCHKQWEVSKKVGHLGTHTVIETEIKGKVETETTSYKVELWKGTRHQYTHAPSIVFLACIPKNYSGVHIFSPMIVTYHSGLI